MKRVPPISSAWVGLIRVDEARRGYQRIGAPETGSDRLFMGEIGERAGGIRAALDEERTLFGERLAELRRSARPEGSRRIQMRQGVSNRVAFGDEGDHAELTAALRPQREALRELVWYNVLLSCGQLGRRQSRCESLLEL